MNILVVDDSRLARKRVKNNLEEAQIEHVFFEAGDGLEALEIMRKEPIYLVVTDVEMPRMNGLELIEEIRKSDVDIEIIVISSVVNPSIVKIIKSDKKTNFIKKPFNFEVFKSALEKIDHNISLQSE
jgi:YesN/AraC family two-component response regulator